MVRVRSGSALGFRVRVKVLLESAAFSGAVVLVLFSPEDLVGLGGGGECECECACECEYG